MTEDPKYINTEEVFMTEKELASRQNRSIRTLQNQRVSGDGVPFIKFGRSVRYRLSDVVQWEASRLKRSTSEIG